jgi:hypothetical protein
MQRIEQRAAAAGARPTPSHEDAAPTIALLAARWAADLAGLFGRNLLCNQALLQDVHHLPAQIYHRQRHPEERHPPLAAATSTTSRS